MPLTALVAWNPNHAPNDVLKIRDSLVLWQKQTREEYKEAIDILKFLPISDKALRSEIDALQSNPENIDEAFKKAQILVDRVRENQVEWENIPLRQQKELNKFSPALPVGREGLASSAEIYSALQQHTMAVRSGRGGNPYFEHALHAVEKHDKDACQSLEKDFRKAPVSLWGGGIAISDHAHEAGYQVLEHSKLGAAFNGVQLHPNYSTYETLWERLSQEFVRYHVEAQRKSHPERMPALTLHTRTLNERNIGQIIELPTALGSSQKGGLPQLTLHLHPMLTDELGNAVRMLPIDITINLNSKQGSSELLESLYTTFLKIYDDYSNLQEAFESSKANPNLPPPENYEAKRIFVNANLWGINEALKMAAEERGEPPPQFLSPIPPWPKMGSSGRSKMRPNRSIPVPVQWHPIFLF